MLRKKDPKYQTGGEFFQQKGAFLDHQMCHKIDVFRGGGAGAGRPGGRRFDILSGKQFGNNTLRA